MKEYTSLVLTRDLLGPAATVAEECLFTEYATYLIEAAGVATPTILSTLDEWNIFLEQAPKDKPFLILRADFDFCPKDLQNALSSVAKNEDAAWLVTESGEVAAGVFPFLPKNIHPNTLWEKNCAVLTKIPFAGQHITTENLEEIFRARTQQTVQKLRRAGIWIPAADTVIISPLYTVESGTFLGQGTKLLGRGKIEKNCVLSQNCRLSDTSLGQGCILRDVILLQSTVGHRVRLGPFSYLRPGSVIADAVKIGDFVEIKNSSIGEKTSVSHLTYIGDSTVGKNVNFGCGTVVSNYDGEAKYRTVINDFAFIGCNTNLVAPLSVGENAYIAAGSTITEDIPARSLAIARQRQTTKADWVTQRKPNLIQKERS